MSSTLRRSRRVGGRSLAVCLMASVLMAFTSDSQVEAMPSKVPQPDATAAGSPFRQAIPAGAAVDPHSASMISHATRDRMLHANMIEFGIPVWYADPRSPRHTVRCTRTEWGPCPFDGLGVPIPNGAHPHVGSDGAMVVVDTPARKVYEFWQARQVNGEWQTSFGAVNELGGSGWGGNSTGSGASRLAGVVRVAEFKAGVIPHALVLQSDNVCAGRFRAPALKTDGESTRSDCIPEGSRIRLDPAVDVSKLQATTGEKAVARAMQVYGAYVIDRGGAPLSVSFELARDASGGYPGAVYRQRGFLWDHYGMPHIPWNRLQVLSAPDP